MTWRPIFLPGPTACDGGVGESKREGGIVEHVLQGQAGAARQGLTLVHFSAQRKRFLWDRGCI